MTKKEKRKLRLLFKQHQPLPILPLRECTRVRNQYDDAPDVLEYGFLPQDCLTDWEDDEIDEFFKEYVRIEYIPSPYDCTGQAFTNWIHWHRNPDGVISYVHSIGVDV